MSTTFPSFDVTAVADTAARNGAPVPTELGPRGRRVLVVDDDPVMRELIARIVLHGGNSAIRTGSTPEAREILDREPVDLVLTDLNMTGLTGLDLLAELSTRRNPPPVLVITACEDAAAVRAARLLGARAVIDKPFSLNALRTAIADALQPPRQLPAAA